MGHSYYNDNARSTRATQSNYASASMDQLFTQNTKRQIHEGMNPKDVTVRESRDSENHPNSVPVHLYLDVTGSMGRIPVQLVREGLPTLVTTLINKGVSSPAIMFGAIGDHYADQAPLQVGQFESGDAELDKWLTSTWLEGNGGGNGGESYALAWYFSAFHTVTDAWEKRQKKGYVFTIGDEPVHQRYENSRVKEIMGNSYKGEKDMTDAELLKAAQEKNHVFHIFVNSGYGLDGHWNSIMKENVLIVNAIEEIPTVIANTILALEGKVPLPARLESQSAPVQNIAQVPDNNKPTIL